MKSDRHSGSKTTGRPDTTTNTTATEDITEVVGDYSVHATRRMDAPGNIRSGRNITTSRGSLVGDVEQERAVASQDADVLPKSVVVYLPHGGKVLAVSRMDDASDKNMPGGLVEPGEDPQEAAVRELWEETGIIADEIFPIFTKVQNGFLVTAYKVPSFHGTVKSSWEGEASWEDPEVLRRGTFKKYYKAMLDSLGGDALAESRMTKK